MQYPEDRRTGWALLMAIAGLALIIGLISGGMAGAVVGLLVTESERPTQARQATPTRNEPVGAPTVISVTEESGITGAVNKTLPGILTILVQASKTDATGRVVRETNLGSGVLIDPRGYVITNQHVVENASKITVKTYSGEERPAVLVGDDSPFTDIAVLQIQPEGLTPLRVGDSDALTLGQQVLAIGSIAFGANAIDFRNNVTRGIISGLHRRWPREDVVMEDLIQTDAAINHGNSGGALITLNGELVGITTTVVRETQTGFRVEGVAFAISSKTFIPVVDQIIRTGKTERPYLGVQHRQITPAFARQAGLAIESGAAVLDVTPESPAARAGIRRGDIIIKLGDMQITDETPYLNILVRLKPNSNVPITLLRAGRELTVDVTIGTR